MCLQIAAFFAKIVLLNVLDGVNARMLMQYSKWQQLQTFFIICCVYTVFTCPVCICLFVFELYTILCCPCSYC